MSKQRRIHGLPVCAACVGLIGVVGRAAGQGGSAPEPPVTVPTLLPPADAPAILLANTDILPRVTIEWPTKDGRTARFGGDRPYASPGGKQELGANVSCYVGLGGTRLERAAMHPKGAIIRVGVYKMDAGKPFFEGLVDEDPVLTVRLTGVTMNQGVTPRPQTTLMHLRYTADDLVACGLGGASATLLLTADPTDTVRGKVTPDNGILGALDGSSPGKGRITLTRHDDGSVDMEASIPYALLRHLKDPWRRTVPGTFLEPTHFHLEFEVIPDWVAAAEPPGQAGKAPDRAAK